MSYIPDFHVKEYQSYRANSLGIRIYALLIGHATNRKLDVVIAVVLEHCFSASKGYFNPNLTSSSDCKQDSTGLQTEKTTGIARSGTTRGMYYIGT